GRRGTQFLLEAETLAVELDGGVEVPDEVADGRVAAHACGDRRALRRLRGGPAAHVAFERTGGDQLVDRGGPRLHLRLHLLRVVQCALDRQADVAHFLGGAGD